MGKRKITEKSKKVKVRIEVAKNMFINLNGYLHKKGNKLVLKDQYNAILVNDVKKKEIVK